jgi:microcystin-dependent protein
MKKLIYIIPLIFFVQHLAINPSFAQNASINATGALPDISAMLDIASGNKGLLLPRVALSSAIDATTISAPATSLLVYNLGTGGLSPAGFYYNSGTTVSPNWVLLLNNTTGFPIGTTITFSGITPPPGYLACDGAAVSRTTYAGLFGVIGIMYGAGNGTTTFNLPDYRGYFLRGWDNGAGNDPDAASRTNRGDGITGDNIGTKQTDQFVSHSHSFPWSFSASGNGLGYATNTASANASLGTNPTGGTESRPKNITILYYIKY